MRRIRRSHIEQWVKLMGRTLQPPQCIRGSATSLLCFALQWPTGGGLTIPRWESSCPLCAALRLLCGSPHPQVGTLLVASDDDFAPLVAICSFAGLRLGEVIALRVCDVDFMHGTLRLDWQWQDRWGASEFRAPKVRL